MGLQLYIYTTYCVHNKLLILYYYIYNYIIIELLQCHTYVNTEQWNCTFVICFAVYNLGNMIIDSTRVFSLNHNYIFAYLLLNTEKTILLPVFTLWILLKIHLFYFMVHIIIYQILQFNTNVSNLLHVKRFQLQQFNINLQ